MSDLGRKRTLAECPFLGWKADICDFRNLHDKLSTGELGATQ